MFCVAFLFSKPALLFVLNSLHCVFLSLKFAFKMLFFLPTEILFVCFLSLTSMLKILFFFNLLKYCYWLQGYCFFMDHHCRAQLALKQFTTQTLAYYP